MAMVCVQRRCWTGFSLILFGTTLSLQGIVVQAHFHWSLQQGASSFIELNPDYVPHPGNLKELRRHSPPDTNNRKENKGGESDGASNRDGGGGGRSTLNDFEEVYYSYNIRMPNRFNRFSPTARSSKKSMGLGSLIRESFALFPSLATTTVVCIGVFLCWRIPFLSNNVLQRFFVASRHNLAQGRWQSLMFAAFSHSGFMHLLVNLLTLLSFGPAVQRSLQSTSLQPWPIWPLLLGASVSGSGVYLVWQALADAVTGKNRSGRYHQGCMGLSAVTCALVAVFCRINPENHLRMLVAGVIPIQMTAQVLLGVLLAVSSVPLLVVAPHQQESTAHAAHLGGLLFGLGYHALWTRRFRIAGKVDKAKQQLFSQKY